MKLKKYVPAVLFLGLILLILKMAGFDIKGTKGCCKFEEAKLEGTLDKVKMARKNFVSLKGEQKDYHFDNKGNHNSNNYKKFHIIGEVGDSVYKAPNADTLWLFKTNEEPIFFEIIHCCEED